MPVWRLVTADAHTRVELMAGLYQLVGKSRNAERGLIPCIQVIGYAGVELSARLANMIMRG